MSVDYLTKYAPKKHEDLLVPERYKEVIDDMFSGRLLLGDKGFVLYGDYGLGKSEVISLLKKETGWPSFTIPDRASANSSTISDIKKAFYGAQNSLGLYSKVFKVNNPRFIIECNEADQASTSFLMGLINPIDEFYKFSKDCVERGEYTVPALWIFTDNFIDSITQKAPAVFRGGRIKPLNWDLLTAQHVKSYAKTLLEREGVDTPQNLNVLDDLSIMYGNGLRELLNAMRLNIK